ncbi:MAG: hypothetical protein JO144_02490 [Actinobacteria bacterium]|nr:hypothetical protein [Actinomycetota bacterium]
MTLRCLLIAVLAAAALGKLRHRAALEQFARVLALGLGLPRAKLVAGGWVAVEAVTALLLVLPPTARPAAVLATAELALLTAGAAVLVVRRTGLSCPCFGTGDAPLSRLTVLRNAALTGAALLLAIGLRVRTSPPVPVTLAAVLTVLVGAALRWQAPALRALLPAGRGASRQSVLAAGGRR